MLHSDKELLEKLNKLIDENLEDESFSTDQICRGLGISRTQLHRFIKEQTQLSTTLYIRKSRLEKAKSLLSTTKMRISEVADAVGINNPTNFSKYFSDEFNASPSDFRKQPHSESQTDRLSIAVLPFLNLNKDIDQEYFSDGITEDIINVFSQVPALKVVGRGSSFAFKGKNEDLRTIGSLLNVSYILEGSVRKSENKLRITTQLVNVSDGFQLWSEKYDRQLADIFDIQDEISLAILKEIKVTLLGEEKENALKRYTNNTNAYQLYLQGRYYHNKFEGAEAYKTAILYFESAIKLEPNYALAYSGIASCYLNLWFYRFLKPQDSLPLMKQATAKAMYIDPKISESYLAQARMELLYEWDFINAEISFKKALALSGNSAELHGQYALLLGLKGNHILAKKHTEIALSLEPFSLFNNYYASYVFWLAGNFEEAILQGRKMLSFEPNFWGGHFIIGLNLLQFGKYEEAFTSLTNALKYNHGGLTLSAIGVFYGLKNEIEKAKSIIQEMLDLNKTKTVSNYDIGIVYAIIGELDIACQYFEKSIENHEPSMLFFKFIARDWLTDFKNDARYQKMMGEIYG